MASLQQIAPTFQHIVGRARVDVSLNKLQLCNNKENIIINANIHISILHNSWQRLI